MAFGLLGLQGASEIVKRVAFLRGGDPVALGLRAAPAALPDAPDTNDGEGNR